MKSDRTRRGCLYALTFGRDSSSFGKGEMLRKSVTFSQLSRRLRHYVFEEKD